MPALVLAIHVVEGGFDGVDLRLLAEPGSHRSDFAFQHTARANQFQRSLFARQVDFAFGRRQWRADINARSHQHFDITFHLQRNQGFAQ